MIRSTRSAIAALFLLNACARSAPVDPPLAARATAHIATVAGYEPPLAIRRMWSTGVDPTDLVCGELEAPAMLRPEQDGLRFFYSGADDHGQVEFHRLWAGGHVGMALVEQNRAIFDGLWAATCLPAAPLSVRMRS